MLWLLLPLFVFGIIYSRFAGKFWWISLLLVLSPLFAALYIIINAQASPADVCYDYEFWCSTTTSDRELLFTLLFLPALGVSSIGAILVFFLSRKSIEREKIRDTKTTDKVSATQHSAKKDA